MSLLDSVNNLTSTIADKAKQLSTITKIAACLPSIITSIPATIGAVAGSIVKSAVGTVTNLLSAPGSFLQGIINETVTKITNAVTGLLNTVLNVQAQILASIDQLKRLADFLEKEVEDTAEWIKNTENCNFAAAELVNCIAGRLLSQLSSTFGSKIGGGFDISLGSFVDKIAGKIEEPGEKLNGWVNNTANQIDKATSIIGATKLF